MAATITRLPVSKPPATPDSAMAFAVNLVAADRNTAARIAAALSAILDASPATPELEQPWLR
jgi:hypothetical protein